MIYEVCVLLRAAADEPSRGKIKALVEEVTSQYEGEVLKFDDWGLRTLAQPTSTGADRGYYLYFIYTGKGEVNTELERRLKINEDVMKYLVVKMGPEKDKEKILKAYKSPFQEIEGVSRFDLLKEKKAFIRKKTCWFSANKLRADWKDLSSFNWLINEFGKISPGRVSGITSKHQTFATTAIKRARCIGLASYTSNQLAE